jgi:DNA modification methylase
MKTKIEHVKINDLREYERNARTHPKKQIEQVARSITEFGFTNPILIDRTGMIIAGHGRLLAARNLGLDEVPCIRLDHLDETQVRALVLADNKIAEGSGWNKELLRAELSDLIADGYGVELTGFDADDFFRDDEKTEFDQPHDLPLGEVAVIAEKWDVQPGDLFSINGHRLLCGDSTSLQDVARLAGGSLVDLLLTDPPYNVDYTGGTAEKLSIKNDKKTDSDFRAFLSDAFIAADSVLKPGGVFYIWHADSEGLNFRMAANNTGWRIRQCLVWVKNTFVMGRQDHQWKHEPCLYGWKHEPCLYGWKDKGAHLWLADRCQTTVLEFNKPRRNNLHPTMKPVELMGYQITNSCPRDGIVWDSFLGSGSTMLAAHSLGRRCFGLELDPKYCAVILERMTELGCKVTKESFNG